MNTYENVKHYYGKQLQESADLKTDACSTLASVPAHVQQIMAKIHPEVRSRYYGCGLLTPEQLGNLRVLDLGCGSGQDVYVLAALVGHDGSVVGVDMTDEQLAVARAHQEYHQNVFGYSKPNVEFYQGYIEKLNELGLEDESFDLIVSNCVINLSPDKRSVLEQAWRLLKPGGELYFSDVYADRRVPELLANDPELHGECLSGALYWNDFIHLAKSVGFADPRLVEDRPLGVNNVSIKARVGDLGFYSATFRLWKLDELEPACEDYGQSVAYRGTIDHNEHEFVLDKHHIFPAGKIIPVCGNTWRMLAQTRLAPHFEFIGDFNLHHGIFAGCGTSLPFDSADKNSLGSKCC